MRTIKRAMLLANTMQYGNCILEAIILLMLEMPIVVVVVPSMNLPPALECSNYLSYSSKVLFIEEMMYYPIGKENMTSQCKHKRWIGIIFFKTQSNQH